MERSKFLRALGALLMILALVLPVAPVVASEDAPVAMDDQGIELRAAHLAPGFDAADCARIVPEGQFKVFLTVQSNTGVDIPNGVGKINVTQPNPTTGILDLVALPMNNGDLEGRANDGTIPGGCTPALPDGHPNDMESPALASGSAVSILLTAPGFVPRTITSFVGPQGIGDLPLAVLGDPPALIPQPPGGCVAGDNAGCLVSLGTFQLQPLAAPAQRGVVAGSVFTSTGQPLDGAVVVLADASGQVHTRISGTDCGGAPLPGTGFYCFSSSRAGAIIAAPNTPPAPFPSPNQGAVLDANGRPVPEAFDGLGLPIGPATIGVVNNQPVNCPPAGAPANAACGFLISTVTVNVAAGTVTGQDIPLGNKFTPSRAAAGAGAVGYVQNLTGRGVGGVTVFACPGADVANCGVPSAGIPLGVLPAVPAPGTLTAVTTPETGLWVMEGLTPATAYTFSIAGPGINPGTVTANRIVGANVRPVRILGGVATTAITRTTGAAGTWIDPNWIVAQGGFALQQPLPPSGGGTIRGQVTDSQGAPFTGPGAVAILWRRTDRKIVAATDAGPNVPTMPQFNRNVLNFPEPPVVRASPIDANGVYCFGAGCPALIAANVQPPLVPDEYLVTILDERAIPACTIGFLAPAGGIPPAPCGNLPATSPPILLTANAIVPPVNFTLVPALAPGSPPPSPLSGGTVNVFGFAWDMSVPGGRPIQGLSVYAVPVGPAFPPPSFAGGLVPDIPTVAALNTTPIIFSGPPWVTGSAGGTTGPILSSVRTPVPGGYVVPPFPNSDPTGRWEVDGLAIGQRYLMIVELPQGYNQCAPGYHDLDVNSAAVTPLFSPFGGFNTTPSTVYRCATDLGVIGVSGPTAGLAAGLTAGQVLTTPWIYGGTFGFSAQNLEPIEPGEIDRRLEQVIPLVSNGGPPAAMGGVDIQTMEIYVTNAGPMRTIAEVRFYASDGKGSAAVLAGTQQADLVPGGGRVFRAPEMPGGFVGWAGIWSFDADGPAQIFGQSSLVAVVNTSVRSAGDAMTESSGLSREEFVFPQALASVPLIYRGYGGTENKWGTLLTITNMGRAGNVVLQLQTADRAGRGEARRCAPCLITKYVNAGGQININFGANDDPDISMLPDGTTFTATLTAGGPVAVFPGVFPGAVAPILTTGYTIQTIHYTPQGRMATSGRGQQRFGTSAGQGSAQLENTGGLFAPLVFNNSNRWDSGLVIAGAQTSGSQAAVLTVTFYKEDGEFVCDVSDRVSSSSPIWYLYLPALQCIPPNYRGTAVIRSTIGSSTDQPFVQIPPSIYGVVQHVNYDRNAAIAYDMIGAATAGLRTDALGELPCVSLGYVTCAWVADFKKSGSINAEGNIGMQTGIRIMNVDPLLTGAPAGVTVNYIDNSGVIWSEGTEQFVVPVFGTHTIFPLYNGRLPDFFRGTARITSAQNSIVVIANVVDYAVNGRDAAGAYNAQYNSGRTY
jgi:hypothetical protein